MCFRALFIGVASPVTLEDAEKVRNWTYIDSMSNYAVGTLCSRSHEAVILITVPRHDQQYLSIAFGDQELK